MKWMSVISSNDSQYEKIQELRCDILTRMKKYEEELNKLRNLKIIYPDLMATVLEFTHQNPLNN